MPREFPSREMAFGSDAPHVRPRAFSLPQPAFVHGLAQWHVE
jgi:hypothetical protein